MSLSDEEKMLADQVAHLVYRASNHDSALIAAIRTKVNYCRRAFPEEFVKVLYSDDREYVVPVDRWQSLVAILRADQDVPERLKSARLAINSENEGLDPTFSLAPDDREKVLSICSDLRRAVVSSEIFDVAHRRRLLNRVAAIEREVHLPKGRLDVILGGVSDIGEAAGKFGKDVKPLVDRLKEIAGIARKNSGEYDQLPAPEEVKQLPAPSGK